jgi:hypothetical protein
MIYFLIKRVIEGGTYDKKDILNKLDFYLLKDRINQEQYDELFNLI